jgi:alkylhydroperoxidase/carboxymuconolactone decarboxylase family protein YurZ
MTEIKRSNTRLSVLSYDDVRAVSPALEHYTKGPLLNGLWKRPEMSPRDRTMVTDSTREWQTDTLNEEAEAQRATQVSDNFGQVSPGLVQNTTDLLFRDLWQRPAPAPRDRSLVTVSALIASGQVAQITYHLNRAMDNGLTQPQFSEVVTHVAFYAGWPNAFSALPGVKEVFEKRQKRSADGCTA